MPDPRPVPENLDPAYRQALIDALMKPPIGQLPLPMQQLLASGQGPLAPQFDPAVQPYLDAMKDRPFPY
jgi:hypothetical protein